MDAASAAGLEIGPWSEWFGAVASIGSVFVVGWFTRKVALDSLSAQHNETLRSEERARANAQSAMIFAFIGEIDGMLELLEGSGSIDELTTMRGARDMGGFVRSTLATAFRPPTQIYNSNAGRLGLLPTIFIEEIVRFYMQTRSLVDFLDDRPGRESEVPSAQVGDWAAEALLRVADWKRCGADLSNRLRISAAIGDQDTTTTGHAES